MTTMTRRSALAAAAALALPVEPAVALDENPRPVFMPLTRNPYRFSDLETINAARLARHEGVVWVWDHRDNLPASYDELDRLPLNIRVAVIEALPIATAVDLVLERIQRSADADREMTDEQRALLAEAPRYLTPEWAEATTDAREAMYPDGGWWQRAKEVFCTEEWRRIFGQSDAVNLWCLGRFLSFEDCARAVGW
jgi:hypothetical protein